MGHLTYAHSRTAKDPISIPVTLTPSQRPLSWPPPPPRHGVMAEAYEEVSWLLDPTQSFGGCHRDTKCEAEGCQRWAGLREKFWGHREPKEPPGIHPSSQGALWSVLQNQVRHLEKPSHIPSKISLMFPRKKKSQARWRIIIWAHTVELKRFACCWKEFMGKFITGPLLM